MLPLGRADEALSVLERACAADPLSPFPQQHLAAALSARGSYTEAIDQLQRLIGLHEDFWPAHFFLGGIYAATGMIPEAIAILEKGTRLVPSYSGITGLLAGCHALSGDRARADNVLATLTADRGPRARGFAIFHAICSEFDQAAGYFEQAIEEREPTVSELGVLPFFDRFRASPHGRALLRKVRLTDV